MPDNIAAYPGQAIGYDPDFRLNVFPPDQPPFYLEGPGPQLPVPPGSDGPRLGMAAPANQNLPPEDPNYDPFPVDIEEYARQQANLWPLPGPNNQRNPAAEQEGFFPPDVPQGYGDFAPQNPGDGGNGYPPGSWPPGGYNGGYGGGGSGGGYFKKREAQPQNVNIDSDIITGSEGDTDEKAARGQQGLAT